MPGKVTAEQRRITLSGIAASFVAAAALWYLLLRIVPEPEGADPLTTSLACCVIAALLTLVSGVEAVAHERLVTPAIDPLAGFETQRMRVNQRYLSNTVEQFIAFAVGLVALSAYASPRLLIILTVVWVIARWAFWIGYHRGPLFRAVGAPGMLQSMVVLLYVGFRFALDSYGQAAAFGLVALFAMIEALLFWSVTRPAQ
jgi:MAPEG family protein